MKRLSVVSMFVFCAGALFGATSTPVGWTDDYDAALKRAADEKKTVLVDFSGSDWCGWCRKLDMEVFDTDVFRKAAAEKYVLLFIDSPQDKSKLSEQAKKRNPELTKKYKVRGFPTVLLLDEKGTVLAETGYERGGPEKYLKHLEKLVKDAPAVLKYIKPIEDMLNAPDEKLSEELAAAKKALDEKYPEPPVMATDEVKDAWRKTMRRESEKTMSATIEKYIPIYEKAFVEAKAMKVPPEMESRKAELIDGQEGNFREIKSMVKRMKDQAKAAD